MQEWLDEFAARGQAYAPGVRYEMAIAVLRNAAVDDVAERDVARIESLLELTASWPPMGGRGSRNVDYFRVMLQSLIGNDEAAVEELQKTLVLENEGFVANDIFGMPPRVNPLIARLKGQDGYAQWQAAFEGRREATRGNLLRMEQDNEILSADDVAL
jgi:hypothetical protein